MCFGNSVTLFLCKLCYAGNPFLTEKSFHGFVCRSEAGMFTVGAHFTPYTGLFEAVDEIAEKVFSVFKETGHGFTFEGIVASGMLLVKAAYLKKSSRNYRYCNSQCAEKIL